MTRGLRTVVAVCALAALLLPTSGPPQVQPAATRLPPTPLCDWAMYGHDESRDFSTTCPTAPVPRTPAGMALRWFVKTAESVTATPSVAGGVAYVGTWDGTFYAIDVHSGQTLWTTVLGARRGDGARDQHRDDYGEITSSAAITAIGSRTVAFVGAGGSMYALDASRSAMPDAARVLWRFDVDPAHPTALGEVESSPVVWRDHPGGPLVIFGADSNQSSAFPGEGVWALDAATGAVAWHFNSETFTHHPLFGCGNVWSSPALSLDPANPDPRRRATLVFGTADCPDNGTQPCPADRSDPFCAPGSAYNPALRWQPYSEAIIAVDARDGTPLWSYQPHPPLSTDDDDFGASAQLMMLPKGELAVGEGNKDGAYSVLDLGSGRLIWRRIEEGNGNLQPGFAIGGFLGATAVSNIDGVARVFGASAITTPVVFDANNKPTPQLHPRDLVLPMRAFSAVDGTPAWQQAQAPSYAATSVARGVVWAGALDGVLRAEDARTGLVLWAFPLDGPISSGVAITDGAVIVGAGTSTVDAVFKACDHVPASLKPQCQASPLNPSINLLGQLSGIYAFGSTGL